jgi:serine/threonine-protein kinase RsbW
MQREQAVPWDGRPASWVRPAFACPDADRLRAAYGRHAELVETLGAAVLSLGSTLAAVKTGAERRRAGGRVGSGGDGAVARGRVYGGHTVSLPVDDRAPGAARIVVEGLRGRIAPAVLEDAQLVVSELVSNSVRHSGAPRDAVLGLCVGLTDTRVCVEVSDPGCGGVVAPRAPDLEGGGGFGLPLVGALAERWGLERVAGSGTRVWAELSCVPLTAMAAAGRFGGTGA